MLSDINSSNPHFSIILGDFSARSNTQTSEQSRIDYLTTSYGFKQLISEPTHILKNSSSCIDLIFTDQPNLITDSGTHPSLHLNCHHNITFCKINLKIIYPPPYRRLVWDFKRANISSVRKAIKMVDWQFMFLNKNAMSKLLYLMTYLLIFFLTIFPTNM